jgi:hypothetical protein
VRLAVKLAIAGGLFAGLAAAQTQVFEPIPNASQPNTAIVGLNTTTGIVRAKAPVDEWFCVAGGSTPFKNGLVDANGIDVQVQFDLPLSPNPNNKCLSGGEFAGSPRVNKVNQGYLWGATLVGNQIFFGTTANGQCVTEGGINGGGGTPYDSTYWTCQFVDSPYVPFPLPAAIGDNRPPRFYKYNISTGVVTDITPKMGGSPPPVTCGVYTSTNPYCMDPLWYATRGIRAATSYVETQGQGAGHTFILVSGPALVQGNNKLNYFAYDATANQWVGEAQLSNYNDQRHWVKDSNGVMYAPTGKAGVSGGSLIRYYGNFQNIPPPQIPSSNNGYGQIPQCGGTQLVTGPPAPGTYSCFAFADVGDIDGVGTDASFHEGRVIIGTWTPPGLNPIFGSCTPTGCQASVNGITVPYPYAGLWMSPAIPAGGLTTANAAQWTKIWNALNYEPDPVIACSYDVGAILDWNGYLYFGTMNVPYTSQGRLVNYYGKPTDNSVYIQYIEDAWRAAIVLRGINLTTAPQYDLLYGYSQQYVYSPGPDVNSGTFTLTPNAMGGAQPLYGASGFNNPYTNYIWSMGAWQGRLYVGTMDWSFMAGQTSTLIFPAPPNNITKIIPPTEYGAGLFYFPNTSSKALPESTNGVGNYLNYGIRNIMPYTYPNGSTSMFIGTANPMNLATPGNPTLGNGPYGGWELLELKPASVATKR